MLKLRTSQPRGQAMLIALLMVLPGAWGRGPRAGASAPDALTEPASQWAAEAVANQLRDLHYDHYLRYRLHSVDAKGDQVRDVIESKDGTVARLILRDNHALSAQEDAAERERLQSMIDSPSAFAHHTRNDANGKKTGAELIRLIPAAMIFSYAPGQPQRAHETGNTAAEVVLDFEPNPGWSPPNLASEVLTGLRGRVWIDPSARHVTRLEILAFRAVNVGWGVFAHVYPGGHVEFEEGPAGTPAEGRWLVTHFTEHVQVRALLLKTFKEDAEIRTLDAVPVAAMPYPQAIRMLMDTPLPTH